MLLISKQKNKKGVAMDKLIEGKKVFDAEIEALIKTRDVLDDVFVKILDLVANCQGKVIVTGMGKPGHVAIKIAATFASLGTPSFCLHPAEAMHGDLGMISENDIVIAISYSGESDEIVKILPNIKIIGATLVAITGNKNSTLAQASDIAQILPTFKEACHLGLAPTASTTAALCYGDALAVTASGIYGFKNTDFGKLHPAGALGKKLILKVRDLMAKDAMIPMVECGTPLISAIKEISNKGLGIVCVVNNNDEIQGIITDGDLRRILEKKVDIYSVNIDEVMTREPYIIDDKMFAVDALLFIKSHNINALPIINEKNRLIGVITWQMISKSGIVV